MLVIGEVEDVTAAVVASLIEQGQHVTQIVPGDSVRRLSNDRYQADLLSPQSVRQLHQLLSESEGALVGGAINFLGMAASSTGAEASFAAAARTFNVVKEFAADWQTGARTGGGWFLNVTALGGRFGLNGDAVSDPSAAGTIGIAKTLHREHPQLRVKNIDVDPHLPADRLAAQLIQEWNAEEDLLEVGLTKQGRWRSALVEASLAGPQRQRGVMPFDRNAVILLTGGACGVTAKVARALAAQGNPRLILVGRSPLPVPESMRTCGRSKAELRQSLIEETRTRSEPIVPAKIERSIHRILKDREIRDTLEACRAAGAAVEYHSLDVRDAERFGRFIDDLYDRFGRIDGVVHGAGIIADKRIAEKSLESFADVFRTKVNSAWTLARKLRWESLSFLAFFGSVSGRFGNAGQVDYSAANEMLNKLADHLHHRWPGKIACLNWGPWAGGMVSEDLRQRYAAAGIGLIAPEAGVDYFLSEIHRTDRTSAEVVLMAKSEALLSSLAPRLSPLGGAA